MKKRSARTQRNRISTGKLLLLLLFLIVLLSLPFFLWHTTQMSTLSITVYDKTVKEDTGHHEALAWFLRQHRYPTRDGYIFDSETSYLGYHPDLVNPIIDLSSLDDRTDLLYIADTYGVFKAPEDVGQGESPLLWGGTSLEDVKHLKAFLNRKKSSTLIAESNSFADATPEYVQSEMYQILGTRWSGWIGLYVYDLANEAEIPLLYRSHHEQPWEYQGEGIVLMNEQQEVLVLEGASIDFAYTEEGMQELSLTGTYRYTLSFEITQPLAGTEVLAQFMINTEPEEDDLLSAYGIPSVFPAVQMKQTAHHRAYYLSGNWAYNSRPLRFSRLFGMAPFMARFSPPSQAFMWKVYMPLLESIFLEAEDRSHQIIPPLKREVYTDGQTSLAARSREKELQIYEDGKWKPFFVEGVNLGTAMPGRWFTDFPSDMSLYYRWMVQMGELGVNTLRIYTLLDPQFYDAFSLYNRLHREAPLYLMQEIWPEEHPPGLDYLKPAYVEAFEKEIEHVVDAIHGNADIKERQGRAWGNYTSDVSDFVIGYLVGRELEPHEVEETDSQHRGYRFTGSYLSTTEQATPTESWLAASCDYLTAYEQLHYGKQHPTSIVNWPILDYIDHESERDENGIKENEFNDRVVVDINNILLGPENKAGFFGSYHIYPNYPDFMNNDPLYDQWEDEQGRFRYGGYLREFMEGHQRYPAVVAEFGLATGMGNAHENPDGYHHGGMSEQAQGEGIIRMFEAMKREGYSGGIIFAWMDEWAKKTWTTEPYMIPYDRHILWHNTIDPEQNYGLLAYEAVRPTRAGAELASHSVIERMKLAADASYLWIDILLAEPLNFDDHALLIGIDTLYRDRGELRYLPSLDVTSPTGMEYLVRIDSFDDSRVLAIEESDYTRYTFSTAQGLKSTGEFNSMRKLINKARALEDGTPIPALYEDASLLRFGSLKGNTNHWTQDGKALTIRIPWTRIQVSDPSSGTVLDDEGTYYTDPLRDTIATTAVQEIHVSALLVSSEGDEALSAPVALPLPLQGWNQAIYEERMKDSYTILKDYFNREEHDE